MNTSEQSRKCFICGEPVASNVSLERQTGMCSDCICDNPDVATAMLEEDQIRA